MPIALIAAAAGKNLVIGKNGDLPWHFSSDLKYFKEKTMGHPVVMGRVTFQSILKRLGKPLPGRHNFVLTHDPVFKNSFDNVTVFSSPDEVTRIGDDKQIFIIGGAAVYKQTLDFADTLYLTHIDQEIEGDAFFPPLDERQWALSAVKPTEESGVKLYFNTYKRI